MKTEESDGYDAVQIGMCVGNKPNSYGLWDRPILYLFLPLPALTVLPLSTLTRNIFLLLASLSTGMNINFNSPPQVPQAPDGAPGAVERGHSLDASSGVQGEQRRNVEARYG